MMCSTTLGQRSQLAGFGVLLEGTEADMVVVNGGLEVVRTFIAGRRVCEATHVP